VAPERLAGSGGSVAASSRSASISPAYGLLLMKLVRSLAPRSCLELGTGFGISGAYQAAALSLNGSGRLVTLDGAEQVSAIAREGIEMLGLGPVEFRLGMLQDGALEDAVEAAAPTDFALVDAGHDEHTTLRCFEAISPSAEPGAVLVFDDIRWSEGMRRAWRAIAAEPRVALAVDAGRIGIAVLGER
jgi:predicted O-methyltransferase YrrM